MDISYNGLRTLILACEYAEKYLESENKKLRNDDALEQEKRIKSIEDMNKNKILIVSMGKTLTEVLNKQKARFEAKDN